MPDEIRRLLDVCDDGPGGSRDRALLVVLIKTSEGPEQAPPIERTTAVRVIQVPEVKLVPRVLAYGEVTPGRVWEAVFSPRQPAGQRLTS